jgi:hypothetical protein
VSSLIIAPCTVWSPGRSLSNSPKVTSIRRVKVRSWYCTLHRNAGGTLRRSNEILKITGSLTVLQAKVKAKWWHGYLEVTENTISLSSQQVFVQSRCWVMTAIRAIYGEVLKQAVGTHRQNQDKFSVATLIDVHHKADDKCGNHSFRELKLEVQGVESCCWHFGILWRVWSPSERPQTSDT